MKKTDTKNRKYEIRAKEGSAFYKFYLINPKENASISSLAEKLISFKDVEEVYVTEGAHGFLVKTKFLNGKEPKDLDSYIKRRVDQTYGEMNAYFSYKRA